MGINFLAVVVAALVPTVMGFIWYHEKTFGNVWATGAGMTKEKMESGNMPMIFGIAILFSLFLSFSMNFHAVHDFQISGATYYATDGTMAPAPGSELAEWVDYYFTNLAPANHTFSHGATHGLLIGLMLILPIIVTNSQFERRGWKYSLINSGYWILCLSIMGGIISAWR